MKSTKLRSQIASLALGAVCALALAGCGRENKVYSDPANDIDETVNLIDGRNLLPTGFFDQSVNQANLEIALDGHDETSTGIQLLTWPTSSNAGAFNGAGTGSLALLGIAKYSSTKLSALGRVSFDSKIQAGSHAIELLLVIDLDCNSTNRRVLIAEAAELAPGTDLGDGYRRYEITKNDSKWKILGADLLDPLNPASTLVHSNAGATNSDLSALIAAHPAACIRNGVSTDAAMPSARAVSAILFSLGGPNTTDYNAASISRIAIGSDIYDSTQWSAP